MSNIDLLEEAIKSIDTTVFAHSDNNVIEIINERSFAYELYRVWYSLNKDNQYGFVINAEVTKKIEKKFEKNAVELFGAKVERFLPDMVLHNSQWDGKAQELICEFKIFNNLTSESLLRGIKKLVAYTTPEYVLYHHFNHAAFILVNGTKKMFINKFKIEEIETYKNSPITCFFVTIQNNIIVERCSLCELLQRDI